MSQVKYSYRNKVIGFLIWKGSPSRLESSYLLINGHVKEALIKSLDIYWYIISKLLSLPMEVHWGARGEPRFLIHSNNAGSRKV